MINFALLKISRAIFKDQNCSFRKIEALFDIKVFWSSWWAFQYQGDFLSEAVFKG